MRALVLLDAALEASAAVLFLAMGWIVLSGLIRTHETSPKRNPLAYSTIAIFWASTVHRACDAVYVLNGFRPVSLVGVLADAAIFVGLLGYWIARFVVRLDINGRVLLFRDRSADRQMRLERLQSALELNDEVVQGLTEAQLSIELDDTKTASEALQRTLESSRHIVSDILHELHGPEGLTEGDLVVRDKEP